MAGDEKVIDFIYIHGVKYSGEGREDDFAEQVSELHTYVLEEAAQSEIFQQNVLKDGQYSLNSDPIAFYWGDQFGESELNFLDVQLAWLKESKSGLVSGIQKTVAHVMRDGFWLAKPQNHRKVSLKLHQTIQASLDKGHQVVILGHSAGSIVTHYYALYHLPYIDLHEVASQDPETPPESLDALKDPKVRYSCIEALIESDLVRFDKNGNLTAFLDGVDMKDKDQLQQFEQAYTQEKVAQLADYNQKFCIPKDRLKGLVTFGSPNAILSSKGGQSEGDLGLRLFKHAFEQNIFWLHINHHDDVIGFPFPFKNEEVLRIVEKVEGITVTPKGGFFFNYSGIKKGANFLNGHFWYFKKPKKFSKAIIDAYEQGYYQWVHPIQADAMSHR
ncbi:MAG: hypothetical protein KTR14_10495 [Vampirovibrio sp.]|nr:hypothetical protein [Vampirovibrio sp.]